MKYLVKLFLLAALLKPASLLAQDDNFRLICPLNNASVVPPPKNSIKYDHSDFCIVLVSLPDTVVKAVYDGKITNVEFDEETKNGVVLYSKINNKEYFFWYTGLKKLIVKRNETIKSGQPLGFITKGDQIEFLMFQFETPVDPTNYLDCGGMK